MSKKCFLLILETRNDKNTSILRERIFNIFLNFSDFLHLENFCFPVSFLVSKMSKHWKYQTWPNENIFNQLSIFFYLTVDKNFYIWLRNKSPLPIKRKFQRGYKMIECTQRKVLARKKCWKSIICRQKSDKNQLYKKDKLHIFVFFFICSKSLLKN